VSKQQTMDTSRAEGAANAQEQGQRQTRNADRLGNQGMMERIRALQSGGASREQVAQQGFTGRASPVPFQGMMEKAFGQSFAGVRAYVDAPANNVFPPMIPCHAPHFG
jgi:hypothetical protein